MNAQPTFPQTVRLGRPVPAHWLGLTWHVACVRAGQDRAGRTCLEEAGVPVFMMEERTFTRTRGRRGRRCHVDRPLLPGYLFVGDRAGFDRLFEFRAEAASLALALEREGRPADWVSPGRVGRGLANPFAGWLGHDGVPLAINGAVMQSLFVLHDNGHFVPASKREELQRRFAIGEEVVVREGPFATYVGIVNSFERRDHVEILVSIFGTENRVLLPLDSVSGIRR